MIPKDDFVTIAYDLIFTGFGPHDKPATIKDLGRVYDDLYFKNKTVLKELKIQVEQIWSKRKRVRNLPDWW